MKMLYATFLFLLLAGSTAKAQLVYRVSGESRAGFLDRVSNGLYFKDQVVASPLNTPGEKIIYFYYRQVLNAPDKQPDSIRTLRLVILIPDTANPLQYWSIDLELDTDQGYGLGIESTETVKTKKEKFIQLTVYHLLPGPGRVRYKGYEHFTLKQRSNNAGFFNDFELTRIR